MKTWAVVVSGQCVFRAQGTDGFLFVLSAEIKRKQVAQLF